MVIPESIKENIYKMIERFEKDEDKQLTWNEIYKTFNDEKAEYPFTSTYTIFKACQKEENEVITIHEMRIPNYSKVLDNINYNFRSILKPALYGFDKNHDSKITRDELLDTFKSKRFKKPEIETKVGMELIDSDGNGEITMEEIKNFIYPPSQ